MDFFLHTVTTSEPLSSPGFFSGRDWKVYVASILGPSSKPLWGSCSQAGLVGWELEVGNTGVVALSWGVEIKQPPYTLLSQMVGLWETLNCPQREDMSLWHRLQANQKQPPVSPLILAPLSSSNELSFMKRRNSSRALIHGHTAQAPWWSVQKQHREYFFLFKNLIIYIFLHSWLRW